MEVAQTYKTSCRYVTYSRFGKLCLIVKEYIVILFLKVIKKDFLMSCLRSLERLQTDKGTEFLNRNFQSFLKERNIHFFTTTSELKASVVECFNRTLKTRMWKYFTSKNTLVYIDILQDIVHGYHNSYHRSIGQSPASVSLLNVGQVRRKLYGNSWVKPIRELKFKLGNQVRISIKSHRTFKKGYLPSWTQEIFTVTKIIPRVPPVYQLRDYTDDEIEDMFYAKELQKVQKSDDIYKIEKILAEKKENGKGACKMAGI